MKVLVFSDLHTSKIDLPNIKPDVIFLLGDIYWRTVKEIDERYNCEKFGVLGNHDLWDNYKNTNIMSVHKKTVTYKGFKIAGFNGSPRYSAKDMPLYSEREVGDFTDYLGKVDIFISHANPMLNEYNDNDNDKAHVGFDAYRKFIKRAKPAYFFHGHLHEEYSFEVNNTSLYSVYPILILDID